MSVLDSLMLSDSRRRSLDQATTRYHGNLGEAASYLEARGVNEQTATGFRLGVVSDPMPGHERFQGWLSLPYVTPAGVVGMKFRNLDPTDDHRWDAPAGSRIHLYNTTALASGGEMCLLVEGEMKTLVATAQLGVPVVGTWGTNWLPHWPRCFGDFDRVIVVGDNDDKPALKEGEAPPNPGKKHAEKVTKTLQNAELRLPPLGVQLDEWLLSDGPEAVREALGL
jgi:hypothetical protein